MTRDVLELLVDLQKQATEEKSHYYVANVATQAIQEISSLRLEVHNLKQSLNNRNFRSVMVTTPLVKPKKKKDKQWKDYQNNGN